MRARNRVGACGRGRPLINQEQEQCEEAVIIRGLCLHKLRGGGYHRLKNVSDDPPQADSLDCSRSAAADRGKQDG